MKLHLYTFLFLFIIFCSNANCQDYYGKRVITIGEVERLAHHRDTIITALNKLFKLEKKENSPGKYQPERINLVRKYILIFDQIAAQTDFVYYNTYSVRTILGKPDVRRYEQDYEIWEYNALQTRFVSIKNVKYSFVFQNDELVLVKSQ